MDDAKEGHRRFFQLKLVGINLISPLKYMLWYSLEAPRCGASNDVLVVKLEKYYVDTLSYLDITKTCLYNFDPP